MHASTPEPEAGAQCGNPARWDLCGGPPVRAVPTATHPRYHHAAPTLRGCHGSTHPASPPPRRDRPPLRVLDNPQGYRQSRVVVITSFLDRWSDAEEVEDLV